MDDPTKDPSVETDDSVAVNEAAAEGPSEENQEEYPPPKEIPVEVPDPFRFKVEDDDDSDPEEFEPSETVRLPVGFPHGGQRYRNVVIEEMCGIDDHLVSSKKSDGNGAKAMSLVLTRCTQAVEGCHPFRGKQNPESRFDMKLARDMTQPDRDFLIIQIQLLSGNDEGTMAGSCPRCNTVHEEHVRLSKLKVIEWPDDKELSLDFELKAGVREVVKGENIYHKKGKLRFPTGKEQELIGKMDSAAEIVDAMLAACITELGELEHVDTEIIKRMKARDRRYLMDIIKRELPGLRQWKEVTCRCGREFDIVLDLAAFFEGRRSKKR